MDLHSWETTMNAFELRSRCDEWLNERWQGVYQNQHGVTIVPHMGKTACFIEVSDTHDGLTRINVHAPILADVHATPEMYQFIATHAGDWTFGAMTLYLENDVPPVNIEFEYSLLGETTTSEQLNYFVETVARTASDLVDTLQPAFGGRTIY
jgi:hypothetical protein